MLTFGAMSAPALAQTPATQAAALSVDSPIGQLLDNPGAHAMLERELPQLVASTQAPRDLSLRALAVYAPTLLTEEKLNAINAALAALPH